MPKKRKCRYTKQELEVHELDVKLRKMTDQQLVEAFNDAQNSPQTASDPQDDADSGNITNDMSSARQLLEMLSEGECKGVGKGTVYKISNFAMEKGLL